MNPNFVYPPFYSHWLKARLPGSITERLATCDNCAMLTPSGLTRDPGPFNADLKCCTYFPFIPNFALGALLSEGAHAELRLNTAAQQGLLLPLGLFASPEHENLAKKFGAKGFGRRQELLCPFFDSAESGCSIWMYRPGVCASYFCKSERGAEGLEFWQAIESYLNHFEWSLANETLLRLGFTNDDLELSEAAMLAEPGEERAAMIHVAWAEWANRKVEFLKSCTDRSRDVVDDALSAVLGDEFLALEKDLAQYIQNLDN
jgi:Fe-S-cluster containining protein